jgi:hypothetical protein
MSRSNLKSTMRLCALVLLLAGLGAVHSASDLKKLPFQTEFPSDFPTIDQLQFADLSKQPVKGEDFLGQAVIMVFFDPGCGKCTSKLPEIEKIRETFKEEGVKVIGLSSTGGGLSGIAGNHQLDWFWATNSPTIKKKLQSTKIFEIFVFDRLGRAAYRFTSVDLNPNWKTHLDLALGSVVERALDLSDMPRPFVGSQVCGMCHRKEFDQWASTPHASSMETLNKKMSASKPDCRACHITGEAGRTQAARRGTPTELQEVGCEECHGPGGPHRTKPFAEKELYSTKEASCVRCHDEKNSPNFNYADALKKVAHVSKEEGAANGTAEPHNGQPKVN